MKSTITTASKFAVGALATFGTLVLLSLAGAFDPSLPATILLSAGGGFLYAKL